MEFRNKSAKLKFDFRDTGRNREESPSYRSEELARLAKIA